MLEAAILRWVGLALVGMGGFATLALTLSDPDSAIARQWVRYTDHLQREVRFLRLHTTGVAIALWQGAGIGVAVLAGVLLQEPLLWTLVPLIAFAPYLILARRHEQRVTEIEAQLDGWLLVLANNLRAAPSLGDAIRSSAPLVEAPLSEELDTVIKEMQLGATVDRAVLDFGARVGSRSVRGALAAILVGRQTGGELSSILEETAASLREMTRLEGVLRAKTAEGRSQAYVLGAIPFFLIIAIQWVDPHWLEPLAETTVGLLVTSISTGLWLIAILLARRILAVDL